MSTNILHTVLPKKIIAITAITLFLSLGFLVTPQITLAQTVPMGSDGQGFGGTQDGAGLVESVGTAVGDTIDAVKNAPGEILGGIAKGFGDAIATAGMGLLYGVFTFATYVLGLAGALFNFAVVYLVFQFATTLGSSPGVLVAWGVIRDFANIILLFGFIFMGVVTILDLHGYTIQKTVPKFIIYAVLLNFSLLGVSAIIDGANVLAATMYNQTIGTSGSCIGFNMQTVQNGVSSEACIKDALNVGIAGKIVEVSRTGTLLSGGSNLLGSAGDFFNLPSEDKTKFALTIFLMTMFIITATVVLTAGAVLLVSRAVVLSLLLVASPFLVIGMVIDPLKKQAEAGWKMLFNNALFAPVFLLLIFVSLKIAEGVENKLTPAGTAASNNLVDALTKGDVTFMGTIMVFILIIGFLIAALIAAKQFSIKFGNEAFEMSKNAIIGAGDKTVNIATWPARLVAGATVGAGAKAAASYAKKSGFATMPVIGRPVTKTLSAIGAAAGKPGKGAVSGLLGAAGIKGAGGGGAKGKTEAEKQKEWVAELQKEKNAKLTRLETEKAALKERMDEAELKRENAAARGDTEEAARQEKIKADLAKQIEEKEEARRNLVFTEDQKEKYNRLTTAGREEMERLQKNKEQAQQEKGRLDASLRDQEAAIAELEASLTNPNLQGEERAEAQRQLLALHEETAKTRQSIVETSTKIAQLQTAIVEQEAKIASDAAEATKLTETAVKEYKTSVLREVARKQEDFVNQYGWTPFINKDETLYAIAALRKSGGKSGTDQAWEHLQHELTHAAEEKAKKTTSAKPAATTASPAAKPAPSGGGDGHGGGH